MRLKKKTLFLLGAMLTAIFSFVFSQNNMDQSKFTVVDKVFADNVGSDNPGTGGDGGGSSGSGCDGSGCGS